MLSYLAIYICAGLICFIPLSLLEQMNYSNYYLNNILMTFFFTVSVISKNIIHYIFEFHSFGSSIFYLIVSILFFFIIFLFDDNSNNKKNNKNHDNQNENDQNDYEENILNNLISINNDSDEVNINQIDNKTNVVDSNSEKEINNQYKLYYYLGYLIIDYEKISVYLFFIKIRNCCEYISYIIIDYKLFLLLLINLFSRLQKLRFKTDYKKLFKDNSISDNLDILYINYSITYFFAFIIYIIFYIIERKYEKLKDNDEKNEILIESKKERNIIIAIIINNTFLFIFSFLFINPNFKNEVILYISIGLSEIINYLFYSFFSSNKKNFITMSGIFAISTLILRVFELIYEPFKDHYWYSLQNFFSLTGIFLSILYLKEIKKLEAKLNQQFKGQYREKCFSINFIFLFISYIIIILIIILYYLLTNTHIKEETQDNFK